MAAMQGSFSSTLFMCVYYISIGESLPLPLPPLPSGFVASLCNALNLRIYCSTSETRRRYLYFIAFEVGELLNSVSFIVTGAGRLSTLLNGTMTIPITAHTCFFERFWVHILIVGVEVPTLVLILISIERICAVAKPGWYNHVFSTRSYKVALLVVAVSFSLVSLLLAGISAWHNETTVPSGHCPIISSTQQWYSTAHFLFIILGYSISFVSLLIMDFYRKKFASQSQRLQRSDSKTSILVSYTGASVALVASPSVVMIGIRWNAWVLDDLVVALTYCTTAMVSIANTAINFTFREEFRRILSKGLNKIGVTATESDGHFNAHHHSTYANTTHTFH